MNLRRVHPDDFRQSGGGIPVAVGQVVLEEERVSGGQAVCRILNREFELSLDQIADRLSLMSPQTSSTWRSTPEFRAASKPARCCGSAA